MTFLQLFRDAFARIETAIAAFPAEAAKFIQPTLLETRADIADLKSAVARLEALFVLPEEAQASEGAGDPGNTAVGNAATLSGDNPTPAEVGASPASPGDMAPPAGSVGDTPTNPSPPPDLGGETQVSLNSSGGSDTSVGSGETAPASEDPVVDPQVAAAATASTTG